MENFLEDDSKSGIPGNTEILRWSKQKHGTLDILQDLDTSVSENLLDCISWPSALVQNDSAYINDPFQLTLSEDHEEDSPKSSSFDSRIHNSDFSLLDLPSLTSLESKSINETLFGKLQPWSPPANYEVPNFCLPDIMFGKSENMVYESDLLNYYAILSGEFSNPNTTIGQVTSLDFEPVEEEPAKKPIQLDEFFRQLMTVEAEGKPKRLKSNKSSAYDTRKVLIPKSKRGRQSKDEDLANQYSLPASANELCMMSHIDLQELLKRDDLTEDQKEMMKKLRRRGRNKIAARRCRAKRLRGGVIDPNDPDLDPEDSMDEDFEDEEAMEEDLEAQIVAKHDESSSGRKRKPTVKLSY